MSTNGPENNAQNSRGFDPSQPLTETQRLAADAAYSASLARVLGGRVVVLEGEVDTLREETTTLSEHVNTMRGENAMLQADNAVLQTENVVLKERNRDLDREASLNPVSRFYNERGLYRHFNEFVSANPGTRLAIIAVDLSSFKAVNDELGHYEGDKLLKDIGELFRVTDLEAIVANPHGDEFVIVSPLESREDQVDGELTDQERIAAIIERLKGVGAALALQDERLARLGFGISAGGIVYKPDLPLKQNLEAADAEMYRDKRENLPPLTAEQQSKVDELEQLYAELAALGIPKRLADKYLPS